MENRRYENPFSSESGRLEHAKASVSREDAETRRKRLQEIRDTLKDADTKYHAAESDTEEGKKFWEEREGAREALRNALSSDPELATEILKECWHKYFEDELRAGRTIESIVRAQKEGGKDRPDGEEYDFIQKAVGLAVLRKAAGETEREFLEAHHKQAEREALLREAREGARRNEIERVGDPALQEILRRSSFGLKPGQEAMNAMRGSADENGEKPEAGLERLDAEPEEVKRAVKRLLREYLSYQDAHVDDSTKDGMAKAVENSSRAREYGLTLYKLLKKHGQKETEEVAGKMVSDTGKFLRKLGLKPSPFAESKTWAMWDIAKQQYYFELYQKEGRTPEHQKGYLIESPFTEIKHREMIDRHAGWEAYRAYNDERVKDFLERIPKEKADGIKKLLEKPPKENGTLGASDLAELGKLLREATE